MKVPAGFITLASVSLISCAPATPIQHAVMPQTEIDSLVGFAVDSVAGPLVDAPVLLYVRTAEIPAALFGPDRVRSLMRAAPEIDSAFAAHIFAAQPTQEWQGTLSLRRRVRWIGDSLFAYWRQSPRGYQEFRRLQSGHAAILAVARPVIDTTSGVSLVYVESLCGPFCDSGRAYLFVRDSQHRWAFRRVVLYWES